MSSQQQFTYTKATIGNNLTRSRWKMPARWQGSIFHGDFVPLEIKEILPSDVFTCRVKNLTRTATSPIYPIMDNITEYFGAWFVPKRLVSNKVKEFYGENETGYGIQSEIIEPTTRAPLVAKDVAATSKIRSIGTYLGLVRMKNDADLYDMEIALNPVRAYLSVYNYWIRNQNFMSPYLWNHDEVGVADYARAIATLDGSNVLWRTDVPKVCKKMDLFTSCLPWSQKIASPVSLPLGTIAPVIGDTDLHNSGRIIFDTDSYPLTSDSYLTEIFSGGVNGGLAKTPGVTTGATTSYINQTNLVADLSNALAPTINQLRMSVALQRYYESLARCGSFYTQYIAQFFNCETGDSTAQVPEYLGGIKRNLNIAPIYSTADYQSGSQTKLGAPGGVCATTGDDILFKKAFTEPGYLVICYWTKHDRSYSQGIDAMWRKTKLLDYYNPKFAHLGETPVDKTRIFFTGQKAIDVGNYLGFNEAWNDYRYIEDKVIGALSPALSNSYNFVNLSENFATAPTLASAFLTEDRDNIVRCLAGGVDSPDYFLDVFFDFDVIRPMPVHSIPGLMDHF